MNLVRGQRHRRGYGHYGGKKPGVQMSVSRVSIHTDRDGDPVTVDVGLPSGARVGELVPAIVDMVDGRAAPEGEAVRWRLDRAAGGTLDDGLSLTDNGVEDGELLTLIRGHAPALGPLRTEPGHAAVIARQSDGDLVGSLRGVFCVSVCGLASVALAACAGSVHATTSMVVAALGACAVAVMAVATGCRTAPSLAFVCLAAATGYLAVPSGPAAPNVLLAAAAALAVSLSMMRLSGRVSAALTATSALSLLSVLATVAVKPVVAVGAALACASLVLLALAPRVSVLAAGLGADKWDPPERGGGDVPGRVDMGHAILSGLVVGGAAGTASGAVVVVAGDATGGRAALAFTGVLTSVLLLRARTYVDPVRRTALCAAGFVSGAACLAVVFGSHREYLGVAAGVLVATALVTLGSPAIGASWSRLADRSEYVVLAAVVPVAGWVGGVYDVVAGFHP
jgi:type VII secretion integral membrane protein EccD